MEKNLFLNLLLIGILTLINSFFAACEIAVISINKHKLTLLLSKGDKNAILLDKILKEPTKFLSIIQVAITFAGFFSSASAATYLSIYLDRYLRPLFFSYSRGVSIFIITILISYITLIFGELLPKRIALAKSEYIALKSARIISLVAVAFSPFVKILTVSTNFFASFLGMENDNFARRISEEEIIETLKIGEESGLINDLEYEMLTNIFQFEDLFVNQIMTPRSEIIALNINDDLEKILEIINKNKFTRYPVYDGELDNIIGILNIKTLLEEIIDKRFLTDSCKNKIDNKALKKLLIPPIYTLERKHTGELFKMLKSSKAPMAILQNEYGFVVGLATMEDFIEIVMGDIVDEYDDPCEELESGKDGNLILKSTFSIHKFEQITGVKISTGEFESLGGYVLYKSKKTPRKGDIYRIEDSDISLEIFSMNRKKIGKIKVIFHSEKSK